jgi:hypothetical protein
MYRIYGIMKQQKKASEMISEACVEPKELISIEILYYISNSYQYYFFFGVHKVGFSVKT